MQQHHCLTTHFFVDLRKHIIFYFFLLLKTTKILLDIRLKKSHTKLITKQIKLFYKRKSPKRKFVQLHLEKLFKTRKNKIATTVH